MDGNKKEPLRRMGLAISLIPVMWILNLFDWQLEYGNETDQRLAISVVSLVLAILVFSAQLIRRWF
mgnify:CR=1 FL=1